MSGWLVYVFEAKGIQAFITAGGRLRDLAGGSALVEALCVPAQDVPHRGALPAGGLLDDCLAACGLEAAAFIKRAAGAFTLIVPAAEAEAKAFRRFADLWPLVVARAAPGLEAVFAEAEAAEPKAAADLAALRAREGRNRRRPRLPQAGPLVARAPRTGEPAARMDTRGDARELLDHASVRKRRLPSDAPSLARRVLPEGHAALGRLRRRRNEPGVWPLDMQEDFPFRGEERTVAVIHADANRMGLAFIGLAHALSGERYAERMRHFSGQVQAAMERSVQAAVRQTLPDAPDAILPARPILVGGDDISIILRADLAFGFCEALMQAFEAAAKTLVADLAADLGARTPPQATLTAGIAFVGASQPFAAAHRLAEELCKHAKSVAKAGVPPDAPVPTTLAFHRLTSALTSPWATILERDLTVVGGRRLTLAPYRLGEIPGARPLPSFRGLLTLAHALGGPSLSRGPARELLSLLHLAPETATRRYRRWRSVVGTDALVDFDRAMRELGAVPEAEIFLDRSGLPGWEGEPPATPLADAVALLAATGAVAEPERAVA